MPSFCQEEKTMENSLKIVTFNLRLALTEDGENCFFNRLPLIVAKIQKEKPDVIGTQETTDAMRQALLAALPEYSVAGAGRNTDRHGEGTPIFYRHERLAVSDLSTVWLSSTPHIPGTRYENSDQSYCPRVLVTATFVPNDPAMLPFRVYNLHTDHEGAKAREYASRDLLAAIREDTARDPLPFAVMGDLNAAPDSREIRMLSESEEPKLRDITDRFKLTFHGFHRPNYDGMKIDYIFLSEEWKNEPAVLWTETDGKTCLSDHYPIAAVVALPKQQ